MVPWVSNRVHPAEGMMMEAPSNMWGYLGIPSDINLPGPQVRNLLLDFSFLYALHIPRALSANFFESIYISSFTFLPPISAFKDPARPSPT